jgi:hypothetical protein
MLRITIAASAMMIAGSAWAQDLPQIDIESHCKRVGGGSQRMAACRDSENEARLWLEARNIPPAILYQCKTTLASPETGYVIFRSCVMSKSRR